MLLDKDKLVKEIDKLIEKADTHLNDAHERKDRDDSFSYGSELAAYEEVKKVIENSSKETAQVDSQETKRPPALTFLPAHIKVVQANFGAFNLDSELIFVDQRIADKEILDELYSEFIHAKKPQQEKNVVVLLDFIDFVNDKFTFEEGYFTAEVLTSADLHWNM